MLESDRDLRDVITELHHINDRGGMASRAQTRDRPSGRLSTDLVFVGVRNGRVDVVVFDDADSQLAMLRLEALTTD